MYRFRCGASLATCLILGACASAPSPDATNSFSAREVALSAGSGALEAELDPLLAAHDYVGLGKKVEGALGGPDDALRLRTVNWLALKQSHGETDSIYIAQLYTVGLGEMAVHSQEPGRTEWFKDAASAYARTFIVLLSESGQCADSIAVDARLGQVSHTLSFIQPVLAHFSPADRDAAVRSALVLATLTFRKRYPDDWLCRGRDGGPAKFNRYEVWGPRYGAALENAAKGMFHDDAPKAPTPALLLRKNPEIAALYR